MSNFKKELSNYQIIPRDLIFDSSLTDRARFVYCFMASKPDDWDFFLEPMSNEIGYSKDTLRKYINELVSKGWLVRGEQINNNGVFGAVEYTLKASKLSESENTVSENFRCGKNPTQQNRDNIENIDSIDSRDSNIKEKDNTKVLSKKKCSKEVDADFEKFNKWILTHAPRVAKMQRPFTIQEYYQLKDKVSAEEVRDILIRMDNYKGLYNNLSAFRTLLNWYSRNKNENTKPNSRGVKVEPPTTDGWGHNILDD